jgi:type II secretory pathway pseudopilin PulG
MNTVPIPVQKNQSLLTSTATFTKRTSAMTMIEVLMVLAAVMVLAAIALPALLGSHTSMAPARATRIQCVNNLKQVGLSFRVWEGDNGDKYPMSISETNGGTIEYITGTNAWRHFQVMSNELMTPKILFCPAESDHRRTVGTNFYKLDNRNLSYFVGTVSNETNPQLILSGDHNITNGTPVKNGVLELTTSRPAGWSTEMHKSVGNLGLADGSVQQVSISGLQTTVTSAGVDTNLLQMPVLTP